MRLSTAISTRLQHQHTALQGIIQGLTADRLKEHPNPGKWSPFENIAHLAAYQPVFLDRIDRIRKEESPIFERYVAEQDPHFPEFLDKTPSALIQAIDERGAEIAHQLSGWDEVSLRRTGRHQKYGLLTMAQWSEFYLLHEAHHLFVIFMLVQDLRSGGEK